MAGPNPGSLRALIRGTFKNNSSMAGQVMHNWNLFLGKENFDRKVRPTDAHTLAVVSRFVEIYQDTRLRGQIKGVFYGGQYLTEEKLSPLRRLEMTVQNYDIGKKFEHELFTGTINENYFLTVEPHIPYNHQEGLWMLKLSDLSLRGSPIIAKIGVNFHLEHGKVVVSVGVIQGSSGASEPLHRFNKLMKRPWPIFMLQVLHHYGNTIGASSIRGVPEELQPFFKKKAFFSGKSGGYSLYEKNFKLLGFKEVERDGKKYYELTPVGPLRTKRINELKRIFPPNTSPPIPPLLKKTKVLPKPHKPKTNFRRK
jgi:hypothetical protein